MSRHTSPLGNGRELVIGWDHIQGGSFFVQIFDESQATKDNEEGLVVEIGSHIFHDGPIRFQQINTPEELAGRLLARDGIELTGEQLAQLAADKEARGSELTPFQEHNMSFVNALLGNWENDNE